MWWRKRCDAARFAERNATISRRRFREGEARAEPQDSFLNHRGHRGHRVARPDAFSVSLWLKERFLIGAGRSGTARQEPRPPRGAVTAGGGTSGVMQHVSLRETRQSAAADFGRAKLLLSRRTLF
jgi:hypothetical protein